ncbi:MAG TPA: sigma-70 family RNA polymerase sigma factor, partial [Planctomycetota bacterium]|nr:sigma-70 family RNA polymerase sigma factor [Planctomycetota bacterium]
LIDCIQKGDEAAFRQLVERFHGRLCAYAARRLSGSGIDGEDAVQETFLGLLQGIEKAPDRLAQVRSLEAYLFQILRNKIFDLTAKRPEAHGLQRVPLASEDADGLIGGFEPLAPGGTPSSHVRKDEDMHARRRILADILEEVISALREEKAFRDLKILELLFFSSWRNRDIAAAVDTSEPTVTRVKQEALAKLSRLAARHPLGSSAVNFLEEEDASRIIQGTWRANLLSCVKRSTLGAFALGALEPEWRDYVAFHLDVAGCETCAANLQDMKNEGNPAKTDAPGRVFTSSIGFLRKLQR